jgi:GNAT superfamily N-acetyltransferase
VHNVSVSGSHPLPRLLPQTGRMIELRPATPGDAPGIADLHAVSWRSAYRGQFSDAFLGGDVLTDRMHVWTKRLQHPHPHQEVTIAEIGGELIGFSCTYANDHPQWGTLLDNLHVQPTLKGKGVGSALLSEVVQNCCRTPVSSLYLWVLDANQNARRFYERHGGRRVGEEPWSPPGGGSIRRLRYAWSADDLSLASRNKTMSP